MHLAYVAPSHCLLFGFHWLLLLSQGSQPWPHWPVSLPDALLSTEQNHAQLPTHPCCRCCSPHIPAHETGTHSRGVWAADHGSAPYLARMASWKSGKRVAGIPRSAVAGPHAGRACGQADGIMCCELKGPQARRTQGAPTSSAILAGAWLFLWML